MSVIHDEKEVKQYAVGLFALAAVLNVLCRVSYLAMIAMIMRLLVFAHS